MNFIKFFKGYFKAEILTILFLGFSAGIPLALILSTLKALLVDQGASIATIGFFSLVAIPYSFKFLWAPIIDSASIPYLTKKLGRRRSWIIFSQISLIIFIAALGYYGTNGNLLLLSIFALLTAFASATQDIVVDAYRIEIIKPEDRGIAAGMYVYGYRIAMLISGAGGLFLSDLISWDLVYYTMSLVMIVGIVTTLLSKEKKPKKVKVKHNLILWFKNSVIAPLNDFFKRPSWYIIFLFIICFKLGDAFAGTLTLPFLLDIGFSKTQIAGIVKTFGLFATLAGVFLGGSLIKYLGLIRSLWIAAILQMLSNLAFYYQSIIGYDISSLYFVIFIENFSGGIGDAVFIAYLSSLCNISFTATQYALLISLATMSRSFLSSTTGIFVTYLGWGNFFLLSTAVALPGILFLYLLTRGKNVRSFDV